MDGLTLISTPVGSRFSRVISNVHTCSLGFSSSPGVPGFSAGPSPEFLSHDGRTAAVSTAKVTAAIVLSTFFIILCSYQCSQYMKNISMSMQLHLKSFKIAVILRHHRLLRYVCLRRPPIRSLLEAAETTLTNAQV